MLETYVQKLGAVQVLTALSPFAKTRVLCLAGCVL